MRQDLKDNKKKRIGETNYNYQGYLMTVVEYDHNSSIVVEFDEKFHTRVHTIWSSFKNGTVALPLRSIRLESEHINNQGYTFKVVDYPDADHVTVEFQDQYKAIVKTQWEAIAKGTVKNPYHPDLCGVGITGNRHSTSSYDLEGYIYCEWKGMIYRCFDSKTKTKNPAYKDVTCCAEWLVFDNFYDWIINQENYQTLNGTKWNIDKDILFKWNKIYSPDTCCIVPPHVNLLFLRKVGQRGKYPIGVSYNKEKKKFSAQCKNRSVSKLIGRYDTPEAAFKAYKQYKENLIQEIAVEELAKGTISRKCYEAMMRYEVEITD